MIRSLRGIVHGRTVELNADPGVPDGEEVDVVLSRPTHPKTGEGIRRTDGMLVDDAEWDEIMEQIYQDRKLERREQWEDE